MVFGIHEYLWKVHPAFLSPGRPYNDIKKGVQFDWLQAAFDNLKQIFCSAPVLVHPDPALPFTVEADDD